MKITGTVIEFDLYEVLRDAKPEHAADIADALSLNDAIRKNVIDSIVDGMTDMGSGPSWGEADAERKRILEALPQMEQDRIARLERKLAAAQERSATLSSVISACRTLCSGDPLYAISKAELRRVLEG